MPEENSAELREDFNRPFENEEEEKETPSESPTETKPEEEEPSQEGEKKEEEQSKSEDTPGEENIPFHKHPRWKEVYDENKRLREAVDDLSKFREEATPLLQQQQEKPIPKWFADTFGDNEGAWKEYQQWDKQRKDEIKQEIFTEQQRAYQEQEQNAQQWDNWVNEQVSSLQDEGLKFDRNELLKTMRDYSPTDSKGNLDFHKGYEIYSNLKAAEQVKKSEKTEEKKKVAAQTMEGTKEPQKKDFLTTNDLRYKDWSDF